MRRMFKLLGRLLLGLLLPPLLLALAWVASNGRWADAAPQPVPRELLLRPLQVAPEHNAFVALQGLDAPDGADIQAAGQASLTGAPPPVGERLRWPTGELWNCRASKSDCARLWQDQAATLREELGKAAALGARCERLAQMPVWEEVGLGRPANGPLASAPFAALPMPRFAGLTSCVRWLGMQAVLEPDDTRALALLARADDLARRALAGSRSLIGTMIGVITVQNNWLLAGDLIALRGWDRARLEPLLKPLPALALSARHWVPHEAQYGREVISDLVHPVHGCQHAKDAEGQPVASWLDRQQCRFALGLMPEQSRQDSDARWLQYLATLPATGPAPCETLQAEPWVDTKPWPAWRNTMTRWLLDVPGDHWTRYVARQTDLELLRQALLATVQRQPLPGAVRVDHSADGLSFAGCQARLELKGRDPIRLPAL
jgi:hypothetical protein